MEVFPGMGFPSSKYKPIPPREFTMLCLDKYIVSQARGCLALTRKQKCTQCHLRTSALAFKITHTHRATGFFNSCSENFIINLFGLLLAILCVGSSLSSFNTQIIKGKHLK